jgi:hypothetical protein
MPLQFSFDVFICFDLIIEQHILSARGKEGVEGLKWIAISLKSAPLQPPTKVFGIAVHPLPDSF